MSVAIDRMIIDAFQRVSDLDAWYQFYVCNEFADKYPSMQFYLRALYEAEREHRKAGDPVPEYPSGDFENWPDIDLINAAMFASGAAELVTQYAEPKPTLNTWSIDLSRAMTALVCSRLSERSTATGM